MHSPSHFRLQGGGILGDNVGWVADNEIQLVWAKEATAVFSRTMEDRETVTDSIPGKLEMLL